MILIAVIVGYILGASPFIALKVIEQKIEKTQEEKQIETQKTQEEIFNEWLNGPAKKVEQADIFKEYVTGEVTAKGD